MRGTNISESKLLSASELSDPAVLISCGLGTGFLRPAPGTWGSLLGLVIWWFLLREQALWVQGLAVVMVTALGTFTTAKVIERFEVQDPAEVVVDEVAGLWIALLAAPVSWQAALLGFVLFRFFDIFKPWPVSWADTNVKGAWGVMLDDILAGGLALVVLQVSIWSLPAVGQALS